jgi:acyl-CoA thioester hydrolase
VRWSDLDPNRHLNNVMYVVYAQEAWAAMVEAGELPSDARARSISIAFRRPLQLTGKSVLVRSELSGDELVQDIGVDGADGTTSFAHVTSTLGPAHELAPGPSDTGVRCLLRRTDLDATGHVTVAGLLDLVQEGRTRYAADHRELFPSDALVVGRLAMDLGRAPAWHDGPVEVRSRITKVTGALVMIETEIVGGDVVHARASSVHVPVDVTTQQSRRLTGDERDRLTTLVSPGVG